MYTKSKIQQISEQANIKQQLLDSITETINNYDVKNMYVNIYGRSITDINMRGTKTASQKFDNPKDAVVEMYMDDILYITTNESGENVFIVLR